MASGKNLWDFCLSLALNWKDYENLIQESQFQQQLTHKVEGLLYWACFVALKCSCLVSLSDADIITLIDCAHDQLHLACTIYNIYLSQTVDMSAKVSEAEKMLHNSTFYASVMNLKKAAVYAVMMQSFQDTEHWYYCVNEHSFTVSECGMSMQIARCSQCEATVSETHHQPAAEMTQTVNLKAKFERQGQ